MDDKIRGELEIQFYSVNRRYIELDRFLYEMDEKFIILPRDRVDELKNAQCMDTNDGLNSECVCEGNRQCGGKTDGCRKGTIYFLPDEVKEQSKDDCGEKEKKDE